MAVTDTKGKDKGVNSVNLHVSLKRAVGEGGRSKIQLKSHEKGGSVSVFPHTAHAIYGFWKQVKMDRVNKTYMLCGHV